MYLELIKALDFCRLACDLFFVFLFPRFCYLSTLNVTGEWVALFFLIKACSGTDHLTFEAGVTVISEKKYPGD